MQALKGLSILLLLSICLSGCLSVLQGPQQYQDKPVASDFKSTAKGKRVAVIWLAPSYLSTPGFYLGMNSGEQIKATATSDPMLYRHPITRVRYRYYIGSDLVDVRGMGMSTKSMTDEDLRASGKEYVRAFVHTMSTQSLQDKWFATSIPNAVKDYGFQVVTMKKYNTEDIRGSQAFGRSDDAMMADVTYDFGDLPEADLLFVMETMGVGVVSSSDAAMNPFNPNLDSWTLSGFAAIYGSLLDAKSKEVLWQHLAIHQEPLLHENKQPVRHYPHKDGTVEPQVSAQTIQAAVEKSFQKAMTETYTSFFQRAPQ